MATAVGPNIVEDGLVFAIEANSERSYPRNNLDVSWLDYSSGLANGRYSILNSTQPYDILIKNNYASWIGSFSHDILSAENYTIMFDYVADASSSLVLDNDGVNDNNWNATIPVTTSVQTYNVTKAVTATGNIKFYTRRASGGNITISNFRFFKADTVDSLVGTNSSILTNTPTFNSNGWFQFDGTNDYATLPFDSSLNVDYLTAEVWIKSTFAIGPSTRHYVMNGCSHQWAIIVDETNTLRWYVNTSSGVSELTWVDSLVSQDTWMHIACTYDGSKLRIYVNGLSKASKSHSGPITTSTVFGRLMNYREGGYNTEGDAANFKIYNRGLTAAEITQNYNAQKNRFA